MMKRVLKHLPKRMLARLTRYQSQACCLAACALSMSLAAAQPLNPAWDGDWVAAETTQGRPDGSLRITRKAAQTQLIQHGQACPLVYDGMAEPAALARRIQALQAWQMDARHWPAGTQPAQLVGLRHEFDSALQLVARLTGTRYRTTRLRGEGCDDADDIFFMLHAGQQLVRLRFPSASLGVDVTAFRKRSSP